MTERRIDLDLDAGTPLAPEGVEAIRPSLAEAFGNPSSHRRGGGPAKAAVERARAQVAALRGFSTDVVARTSGGMGSNHSAPEGESFGSRHRGDHVGIGAVHAR